jgi:hypothetical protein
VPAKIKRNKKSQKYVYGINQTFIEGEMKKILAICIVLFFPCCSFSQQEIKMTIDEYNKEKEAILNVVINSVQFDSINSIYSDSSLHFVFAENEILYKDIPITLTYKNQKVEILDRPQIKENYCWEVGDFFLNIYIENPKNARIMIGTNKLRNKEWMHIGIILEKCKEWKIKSFTLID